MTPKQLAKRKRDRARRDAARIQARRRARSPATPLVALVGAPPWQLRAARDALLARAEHYEHRAAEILTGRRQSACEHPDTLPPFDADAARGLDEREVRRRWPRFEGPCPACGALVIGYASAAHYIAGDW